MTGPDQDHLEWGTVRDAGWSSKSRVHISVFFVIRSCTSVFSCVCVSNYVSNLVYSPRGEEGNKLHVVKSSDPQIYQVSAQYREMCDSDKKYIRSLP